MGLIEGHKQKYYLYQSDGCKICSVIPLDNDIYNLGDFDGIHTRNVFKGNVSKAELDKLKQKYKLYRKEELQHQTTLDEFLFSK
ncbi:hypothetical protein H6L31_04955 [Staphylococcus epidermidis]|uniref:hypothetical protein n=2 Tax=Staphylococcus epidermidis TaxID=1282 RepID=UPI00193C1289|nr:hypothetical protein [Staphylococcus epidermidis]MBM6127686.1 hypothetical protein [Staphylococcus epidermidis]MBM6134422.1 hypothetical protein [Staphylococcus epidermidis]MBM6136656.1 hypothetical protein [Staphylococcus epidermidis]MBM6141331.1 hypothetical protein [Staphylococcus epidermidis]MBM6143561.1 hypothetical protein [Staphylococcus epidermidis]